MLKEPFKTYFKELLGEDESEQFFSSIEKSRSEKKEEAIRSIRVNTLRISKKDLSKWFKSQGYEVSDSPYSTDGLELKGSGQEWALKLPYHAGFTYPQDAASMFAVEVLNPQPGEFALDLTAAPGGKSTHIAQRLENTGALLANDMDTHRLKALRSNLSRLGIVNAYVSRLTSAKMADFYPETFDRILLDPSCSGEGLFVASEGQPQYWNKKGVKHFAGLQFGLLRHAFRMLKPGGRLVYSTCALNAVENDGVLDDFLAKTPEAALDEKVLKELTKRKIQVPQQIAGLKGIRFWPHKTGTKGFFCVAITKTTSQGLARPSGQNSLRVLKKNERAFYDSFLKKTFGIELKKHEWVPFEHHLFLVAQDLLQLPPPPGFSLSLPALKTYEGEAVKPSHEGSIHFGGLASKGILELSKEQMENAMRHEALDFSDVKEGMYLATYLQFPIGLLKIGSQRTELLVPKMA